MAREFVDVAGRPRHRQFALPWLGERRRVVDLELIQKRIGVEKTEALDQVQISVPAEIAAGVPVEAAAVVEVRGVNDKRVPLPATDRIPDQSRNSPTDADARPYE